MSRNTNPSNPHRATDAARSPGAMARKSLRDLARRYLQGRTTDATYRARHAELSAIIAAAGLTMPDVPPPPAP